MHNSIPYAVGVLLAAVAACKGTSAPAPSPTAGVVQPPPPAANAATAPVVEPQRQVLAHFEGSNLQECVEITTPPGKEAVIAKMIPLYKGMGFTQIGQRCGSLGRTELGSCQNGGITTQSTYAGSLLDAAMADCVKQGGSWTPNNSPEANLEKAQQDLAKLKAAHGR